MTFAPRREGAVSQESARPHVDAALFERVTSWIRTVAEDETVAVQIGEQGKGNFFDEENNRIVLDPLDLTSENIWRAEIIGVHEAAHRAISRSPKKLGLTDEKINELFRQLGFGYLHNIN